MMTRIQKVAVCFALLGVVLGWFLTAFVFYPPHARWNEGLGLGDVATWFSAVATFGAVAVALYFGLRQIIREREAERQLRGAIANALLVDLWTIRDLLVASQLKFLAEGENISDDELRNTLNRYRWLQLPSFDNYREQLPKLGADVAPYVVEAYGLVVRLSRISIGQSTAVKSRQDDLQFAQMVYDRTPHALLAIWRADKALKPLTRELILPGEPALADFERVTMGGEPHNGKA
jgi:hypothetical protein